MVTIQRIAATLVCVALLTNCTQACIAASQVNFKFVDPNQSNSTQGASTTGGSSSNANSDSSDGAAASTDATSDTSTGNTQNAPASSDASSGSSDKSDKSDKSDTSTNKPDVQASGSDSKDEASDSSTATKDGGMQSGKLGTADQDSQSETSTTDTGAPDTTVKTDEPSESGKILQGYVRVVPSGTKVPIIMDTAIDSDTSQEGDEFSARTGEDLDIDGSTVVPAGSTIRGRVAQLNLPRRMDRSGSVALKFDTITTPDNRQIPLVANLVARAGVVHAKRGIKDIAIDTSAVAVPVLAGLGIGLIAGNSSSSIGAGGGALIGAGLGVAVGVAILLAKKGKKVDVRPGDELKIELAEDLRMPM